MIVDNSEEFRQALDQVLCDTYNVHHCTNGRQALEIAPQIHPDVIILDLMLTELDGVTLLHEIRRAGLQPMVLAVTRFFNDYVLESAQELGIGYIIRKPCTPAAVSQRVRDLTKRLSEKQNKPINPVAYVTERIESLNFSPRHNGSKYIKEAVLMMCRQPDISITKELYPSVGTRFGSSALQVERSIRTAINAAWSQQNAQSWASLFPAAPDGTIPRPSNGTFIARLAAELREKLEENGEQ